MDWPSLILLSFALCFDSVAVSTVVGMCCARETLSHKWRLIRFSLILALMQGLMPFIGWAAASGFKKIIERWDHWIAFGLLFIIGGKMILDTIKSLRQAEDDAHCPLLMEYTSISRSFILGMATSIDALIVGVSMALVDLTFIPSSQLANIFVGTLCIALVTFFCSLAGTVIGRLGGKGMGKYSNLLGGIILIAIGVRILLEHLSAM